MTVKRSANVLNIIGTVILVLCIALCLCLAVPRLFGVTSYTVLTGSMEPTIPVGSMVWAKSTDPITLQPGDIAVFYDGMSDVPVTHRVVENDPNDGEITTQGDANSAPDVAAIPYQNIIGKVVLHLPAVGKLLLPLGTLWGKLALIVIIIGALLLTLASRKSPGEAQQQKGPKQYL